MSSELEPARGPDRAGEGNNPLTLSDLLRFFVRRRFTISAVSVSFLLFGLLYCAVAPRRYRSTALVEIRRPEDALGLDHLMQRSSAADQTPNPLEETITLGTKEAELESESLALEVVQDLQMEKTSDFGRAFSPNPLPFLVHAFAPERKQDVPGTSLLQSRARRANAFQAFESHLKVEVMPGTRTIAISYQSPDPDLAASVVNALIADLARYNDDTRSKAVQQLSSWLGEQLESVRQEADSMQQQEAQLRRATETYTVGGTNAAGQNLVYSPLLDHLQQATQALSSAESNLITRGAIEKIVETRDPTLISGLAGSSLASNGNPQSLNSLDLIQQLQQKAAVQQMTIHQDEQHYGSANPKLLQDKSQLSALQEAIGEETSRMAKRSENDYAVAIREEKAARETRETLMRHANAVNDITLKYEMVHQGAADTRHLYTDLSNRVREASVLAGLQSNDMTVVSPAFAPDMPSSPRVALILFVALIVGCTLGVLLAGVQDLRDDSVKSVEIVESELGVPAYSSIPAFSPMDDGSAYGGLLHQFFPLRRRSPHTGERDTAELSTSIHVVAHPDSSYAEALRTLRTAIRLSAWSENAKTILITSGRSAEGKSTLSANLAATFARTGVKTLLVDVDLRASSQSHRPGLAGSTDGLSNLLTGQLSRDWAKPVHGVDNLHFIPAGSEPPDPYRLINSQSMKDLLLFWRDVYGVIILDGPPLLSVIDSVQLSPQVDLVLVVARYGQTSVNSLHSMHRLLTRQVRASIGAVLNAVPPGAEESSEHLEHRSSAFRYGRSRQA